MRHINLETIEEREDKRNAGSPLGEIKLRASKSQGKSSVNSIKPTLYKPALYIQKDTRHLYLE